MLNMKTGKPLLSPVAPKIAVAQPRTANTVGEHDQWHGCTGRARQIQTYWNGPLALGIDPLEIKTLDLRCRHEGPGSWQQE
jgi:hypothetical protein